MNPISSDETGLPFPKELLSRHPALHPLIHRASLRSFSPRDISTDVLNAVLEAGNRAPSGGNLQPVSIICIRKAAVRRQLAEWCGQSFMADAPVHLLFCIDWHRIRRWSELSHAPFTAHQSFRTFWISFQDVVIAAQNICTAAEALGLGSVYIGTILEYLSQCQTLFHLPQGVCPVVLLCMGYPRSRPAVRRKIGISTMVHQEQYREISNDDLLNAFTDKYGDKRFEITDERLETIRRVCATAHGEVFARQVTERIRKQGYISMAQYYFGLHYKADLMPLDNDVFTDLTREMGFDWFRPWTGSGETMNE